MKKDGRLMEYEMNLYQIKDWNEHYENAKSRERTSCSYVCVPNKQSGLSFCRIMAEKDGAMIYGIWCLILGACSQQKKPRHGWLTSDGYQTGTAWVPDDLALKFRRPKSEIERALEVLMSEQVGWIICHKCPSDTRQVPAKYPPDTLERREGIEEKEGKEYMDEVVVTWNSMESLPKVMSLTDKRKKAIKARMDDEFFSEHWRTALGMIVESSFCTGTNERGWKADLDWFLRPDSVPRIMEGKYANKSTKEKAWNKRLSLEEIEAASESKLQGGVE